MAGGVNVRITTKSVAGFLANIDDAKIYRDVIYFEGSRQNLTNDRNCSSFRIFLSLSAVLVYSDEAQALLVCGVDCGVDRETADGEKEGSIVLKELLKTVEDHCKKYGLRLLPGALDQ